MLQKDSLQKISLLLCGKLGGAAKERKLRLCFLGEKGRGKFGLRDKKGERRKRKRAREREREREREKGKRKEWKRERGVLEKEVQI